MSRLKICNMWKVAKVPTKFFGAFSKLAIWQPQMLQFYLYLDQEINPAFFLVFLSDHTWVRVFIYSDVH